MPVERIYPATVDYAGGVRWQGVDYFLPHQTGNIAAKMEKIRKAIQDAIDVRVNVDDLPIDDPDRDTPEWNTYDDVYERPDNSWIDEWHFYWQQNPVNKIWVERNIVVEIYLHMANDPDIGGEDHYKMKLTKTKR